MGRKRIIVLLVLVSIFACAVGLAACGALGFGGGDGEENHDGNSQPTKGLEYSLVNVGTYACVMSIGTATDRDIIIAEEFDGVPVTVIGGRAFENCKKLTSITIPDTVTSIYYSAFEGCSNLRSINIPDSVTSIDS